MSTSPTIPTTTKTHNRSSNEENPLISLPLDLHMNILTNLRAFDLSVIHQTCKKMSSPQLVHAVVTNFATVIYPASLTSGFADEPTSKGAGKKPAPKSSPNPKKGKAVTLYTYEHLRNMELLVVARVLNSPEPSTGFIISKSWCKTALRWLEAQQEQQQQRATKKLSKKKQRLRDRKLSDASPPWPNANIDLLCEHQCLQRCSSNKSARARRRLLDRQAWKILNKLYPDSTQLESALGECVQCTMEAETVKKTEADRLEKEKLERKRPLANEDIRRFYTRRTGVPSQCILPATAPGQCPLKHGNYYVLPRSWCYNWRHYMKTGVAPVEGGICPPPDAASLLCHAHRLALLPPHLEAYLYGESPELLKSKNETLEPDHEVADDVQQLGGGGAGLVPGQAPDDDTLQQLRAAGLDDPALIGQQLSIIREFESVQRAAAAAPARAAAVSSPCSKNELLDRENHAVVEILSEAEYLALEACWSGHGFGLRFGVDDSGVEFHTTQTCRECDATGRNHSFHIKNRSRGWIKKSAEKARAPASLVEY